MSSCCVWYGSRGAEECVHETEESRHVLDMEHGRLQQSIQLGIEIRIVPLYRERVREMERGDSEGAKE